MKLICPSCGAIHSAEAWLADADARQAFRIMGELPWEVSRRALQYLAFFRPNTGRGLAWSKTLRLLTEIKGLVSDPHIQWDRGVARPNSGRAWGLAMERLIENPPKRLPLTNHNYLRAVAYEIANEMDRANEVARNQAERTGAARPARPESDFSSVSVEEMRAIREERLGKRGAR
ncbi:MAG: hypothetical protein RBT11_01720 [Desulfobacterales bacterium]|jgi:hypothetical protein|nr:hypothetical protein [Desulfobacterales bacterium]